MEPGSDERRLWRLGRTKIAGVDEAGRGPLAGPVVAAAVIVRPFPSQPFWRDVKDSKLLKPEERERLYGLIRRGSMAVAVGVASHAEIDEKNILQATLESMRKAVQRLRIRPDAVLVDGNRALDNVGECRCIVGGDRKVLSIAAASIVAKVVRDRIMTVYARRYPRYGFERNRGYPTPEHRKALKAFGSCPIHRRSFRLKGDTEPWLIPP